ncbi:TIGR03086 family metal-binding protein [Frankia gtarii]|uniref:TIGR03086 family metal-binding protein n=2 Tax=Frankia gtarii TaxID=2950102 RepID=UPI0021C1EEF5|nr:TIGR03086 family metal-binding protein [Frankia gtarii]
MPDLLRLDAAALVLLGREVVTIPDAALASPTPCAGWTVLDLVRHMNSEHERVSALARGALTADAAGDQDPRDDFALVAARWIATLEQAGPQIIVPKVGGEVPTHQVIAVHFVDMLVHRWDLARALERPYAAPSVLTRAALPIARTMTGPGSGLNGPGGVYKPPLPEDPALDPVANLAALLGRDPRWRATP